MNRWLFRKIAMRLLGLSVLVFLIGGMAVSMSSLEPGPQNFLAFQDKPGTGKTISIQHPGKPGS